MTIEHTITIKADDKKVGLTLGDLRKLIEETEGKDADTTVRVQVGWRGQVTEIKL